MKIKFLASVNKNERWLMLANFIREAGMQAAYIIGIFGYAAFAFDGNPSIVATIMLVFNVSHMFGSAAGGIAVDRIGPRKTVLFSSLAVVAVCIAAFAVETHLPTFLVVTAAFACSVTILHTAYMSFAPYMECGKAGLRRINSFLTIGTFIAAVVGPALGAAVVEGFSVYSVFLVMAAFTGIAAVITVGVQEKYSPEDDEQKSNSFQNAIEGWHIIKQSRNLRYYLLVAIAMVFGFGAFDALEPVYFQQILQVEISALGWVNAIGGVGLIIGAVLLAAFPLRWVNSQLLTALLFVCGVGAVTYVATLQLWWVAVGQLILGFVFGIYTPLLRTLVQADSPLEAVGRVMGTINTLIVGLLLIPLVIAPWLSDLFGVQQVLIVMGALPIAFGLLLYPGGRRLDKDATGSRHIESISLVE